MSYVQQTRETAARQSVNYHSQYTLQLLAEVGRLKTNHSENSEKKFNALDAH